MPAYNFKPQFASLVERGIKRQTIRPPRPNPTKPGQMLYLYTGMRTRECRKLGEAVCLSVTPLVIGGQTVMIQGGYLSEDEIWKLAKEDGFCDPGMFFSFFHVAYGLCKKLEVIRW